jgi:DNA-binding winged helix-turn-helix (wHTH) protein/Tfp pilus assembly protein PilF
MQERQKKFYEFGAFRLDAEECLLLRDCEPVRLQAKAFDTLLLLVQNSGHFITKDELLEKVWADSFVEENNLTKNIHALRKALNGEGEEFIETVPRRGYRFRAQVREVFADENLLVENQTKYRLVVKEEFTETDTSSFVPRKLMYLLTVFGAAILLGALAFAISTMRKAESKSAMLGASSTEAFEEYKQGRALWQTRSGENLHRATLLLESAVQKDPNFALAHAALADAYVFDYANWKKAETEATEALRIDPALGQPHATIGFARMFWEWRLGEANAEFKKAVDLSPNYATGHQWFSVNLSARGNYDGALSEMKRALELEPDSISIGADLCQAFYFAGKYDEALAQCQKILAIDPNFFNAHVYLYEIYNAMEMWDEAVSTYFKIEERSNLHLSAPDAFKKLREAYAKGGIRAFWRAQIDKLSKPFPERDCYKRAQIYARLGEEDKAVQELRGAYKNRDFNFVMVVGDPVFYDVRDNRDFVDLATEFAGDLKINY